VLDVDSQSNYVYQFAFVKEDTTFRARFMNIRQKWELFQAKSMIRGHCSSRTRIDVSFFLSCDSRIVLVLIISRARLFSCDRKYNGSQYAGAGTATSYTKCISGLEICRRARHWRRQPG
jgi:hypothetical protein